MGKARKTANGALDEAAIRLAARQHGLITRRQLLDIGLSSGAIEHRLANARLHRTRQGVYAVGRPVGGRTPQIAAAVLACGEGALASHASAAVLWNLPVPGRQQLHVSVPSNGRCPRPPGVAVHRVALEKADSRERNGIALTSVARTIVDLAPAIDRRKLERLIDEAVYFRLVSASTLEAGISRCAGRAGTPKLAAILQRHRLGSSRTLSGLEEAFLVICETAKVPDPPEVNRDLDRMLVDFVWPRHKIAVEVDGHRGHASPAAQDRDRRKELELRALGYDVRRYTEDQVERDEEKIIADLTRAFSNRTPPN